MKTYCLILDLKEDPQLIEQYKKYHQHVWPEIIDSIKASGISDMRIYNVADRLVMIIEADDDFSFEKKAEMDQNNAKVQEWEKLMDTYQKRLPFVAPDQKWVPMEEIFRL